MLRETSNPGSLSATTPVAGRIAAKEGIDLSSLNGSGPHGRILKADVLEAMNSTNGNGATTVSATGFGAVVGASEARDQHIVWLEQMLLLRRFEEEAQRQYQASKVGGFLHLGIGEEATTVGAIAALQKQDYLIGAYRTHGYAIARGTEPRVVMAELFGRSSGCSGGRGGSMHTFDAERRYLGGYGIVGGQIPLAGGLGLAIHLSGKDEVVLCQLGDGATDEGVFAETLNMSALWNCPVVFLISNNHYSMGTALSRHVAHDDSVGVPSLSERGRPYGIEGRTCDGMDVDAVYETCQEALEFARSQQRPIIVEAMTYRFRGHSVADPQRYRSKEEVVENQQRDPLLTLSQRLINDDALTSERYEQMDEEARGIVDAAVEFAEASPFPDDATLYDNVYAPSDAATGALEARSWDAPQASLRKDGAR